MTAEPTNFANPEALNTFMQTKGKGGIVVAYRHCTGYEGMVLAVMIVFDTRQPKYELDLQWMALGIDFYGDTLQESYVYRFENLEDLLAYLLAKYDIDVTAIPQAFKFNPDEFPNPLNHDGKEDLYKTSWEQFQVDFKKGDFLDASLALVYNSLDHL